MPHDMNPLAIAGFRLVSEDATRLTAFYRAIGFGVRKPAPISTAEMCVLGLSGSGSRVEMTVGPSRVDLDSFDRPGRPYPADASACDLIFQHLALVTDDVEAAWLRARTAGAIPISRGRPVTLPDSSGGVTAIKFRDPEGHPLEFLQFPPGANPGWNGKGVVGIDHTAMSVGDVARSRVFYSGHGLTEDGATLNRGPAQDTLDGLDGVVVDVVSMSPPAQPPHIELLGYRRRIGRKSPSLAASDIAATRTLWRSKGAALVRDPDGHLHQFIRQDRSPEDTELQ